jgi:hypothetical protein
MGGNGASRGVNTSKRREVTQLQATQQPAGANKRHWGIKTKVAPGAQRQQLKQQQCNIGGGIGGGIDNGISGLVATMG